MLNRIRQRHSLWKEGMEHVFTDDHTFVFTRGTKLLVALTNAEEGQEETKVVTDHPFSPGTRLCDALAQNSSLLSSSSSEAPSSIDSSSLSRGSGKPYYCATVQDDGSLTLKFSNALPLVMEPQPFNAGGNASATAAAAAAAAAASATVGGNMYFTNEGEES